MTTARPGRSTCPLGDITLGMKMVRSTKALNTPLIPRRSAPVA